MTYVRTSPYVPASSSLVDQLKENAYYWFNSGSDMRHPTPTPSPLPIIESVESKYRAVEGEAEASGQ
jgi:hypothetical protein